MHKQRIGVLAAAGLCLVGMVLPWTSLFIFSVSGFGFGWMGWGTLAGIGAAAGIVFKATDKKLPMDATEKKVVLGGGAAAALFPIIAIITLLSNGAPTGIGVFLSLIGGIAILAMQFIVKESGDVSMPTKDSIKEDINEIK